MSYDKEEEITADEKLLRDIFGEAYKDTTDGPASSGEDQSGAISHKPWPSFKKQKQTNK